MQQQTGEGANRTIPASFHSSQTPQLHPCSYGCLSTRQCTAVAATDTRARRVPCALQRHPLLRGFQVTLVQAAAVCNPGSLHWGLALPGGKMVPDSQDRAASAAVQPEGSTVCADNSECRLQAGCQASIFNCPAAEQWPEAGSKHRHYCVGLLTWPGCAVCPAAAQGRPGQPERGSGHAAGSHCLAPIPLSPAPPGGALGGGE